MSKALEYLKEQKRHIPKGNTYDSRLDEAITELEELIKPKKCDGCKYFKDDRKCWIANIYEYVTCERHTFELPIIDRYEPKA